jgi:hypothetical protein
MDCGNTYGSYPILEKSIGRRVWLERRRADAAPLALKGGRLTAPLA